MMVIGRCRIVRCDPDRESEDNVAPQATRACEMCATADCWTPPENPAAAHTHLRYNEQQWMHTYVNGYR
eukprot:777984-Prymnesium_polylepis.1